MFWKQTTQEQKDLVAKNKKRIQEDFLDKMSLVVEVPKTGGSGTSNDGNCARTAFRNHEELANILNLNHELGKFILLLCLFDFYVRRTYLFSFLKNLFPPKFNVWVMNLYKGFFFCISPPPCISYCILHTPMMSRHPD